MQETDDFQVRQFQIHVTLPLLLYLAGLLQDKARIAISSLKQVDRMTRGSTEQLLLRRVDHLPFLHLEEGPGYSPRPYHIWSSRV